MSSSTSAPSLPETSSDESTRRRNEASKRVVLFTVFLDILGFGIIIPQLGIYAAQFGASPTVVTILAATYSFMGFLFTPFWGRLSDRVGRRPVLLYSIFGTALGYVLFALSNSLPLLFAARALDGITGANIGTAQAYLSDVTSPQERAKTFGIFGAIFGVGFALGPTVGGLLAHLPHPWGGNLGIGLLTALLSLLNWALAWRFLPETLSKATQESNRVRQVAERRPVWGQIINAHGFARALSLPGLRLLITVSFITIVAFATLQGTFTIYLIAKYVRPQTQAYIVRHTDQAVAEARRHAGDQNSAAGAATQNAASRAPGHGSGETPLAAVAGGEGGGGLPAPTLSDNGEVTPYSPALGGDFPRADSPLARRAPPAPDLSWRRLEQILVQPRAASLVNWIFTTIGLLALVVQGGLVGPLKKRFGEINLVIGGTLLMAVALALVPMPQHFVWQFPVAAMIAVGNGISAPVLTALVTLLSPEAERGEIIGVFQSTQSLGRIVGTLIGGPLFEHFSMGAPYWTGAVIMLLAFVISLRLRDAYPRDDRPDEARQAAEKTA